MTALSDMPAVLTIEEAARELRIGRSAAYAAARAGELPTIRLGRSLRVPRHRLAEMLGESSPVNSDAPGEGPEATQMTRQVVGDASPV
ncbi:MAG: helix-turn-helix domain-containing protein [Solirubrobacteraceae bacterium]